MGASSWHIKNLKQSILETFDIYGYNSSKITCPPHWVHAPIQVS
jgi:hypothetical protein